MRSCPPFRIILIACALSTLIGSGARAYGASLLPPSPGQVASAVERYAPVVYLAESERYKPDSTADFIAHASLVLDRPDASTKTNSSDFDRRDKSCDNTVLQRTISGEGASLAHVTVQAESAIIKAGVLFCTSLPGPSMSDPAKSQKSSTALVLRSDEAIAHGEPTALTPQLGDVPVYTIYEPHRYITYWFFYPYNGFEHKYLPLVPPVIEFHQGDWEHIVVDVRESSAHPDEDQAIDVTYYQHGCKGKVFPVDVDGDGVLHSRDSRLSFEQSTHPVVYSALGSHASYPAPGKHAGADCGPFQGRGDVADKGARWMTDDDLVDATLQPWWGFAGNWGTGGKGHGPAHAIDISPIVGPLSPNPSRLR